MNMKTKLQVSALVLFCMFCCAFFLGRTNNETTQMLHELSGNSLPISSLKGKWVIVNYWAPWCPICHREVGELNNFYQHTLGKNVVFYGVDYDHPSVDDLGEAVKAMSIQFPVLVEDPRAIWQLDVQDSIPVTFIVNPKGMVAKVIYGPNTEQSLLDALHELQK